MKKEVPESDPEAVKKIQRALVMLTGPMPRSFPAALGGEPDGLFGDETSRRVESYQRKVFSSNWREWDGRIGKNTITAMDAELPKGAAPIPPPPPIPPGPVPPPNGPIEKCKQNSNITLDGTSAVDLKNPSKTPAVWVAETQKVFDTICSVDLGKSLIDMVTKETIIRPFIPTTDDPVNAYSKGRRYIIAGAFIIEFSAHIFAGYELQAGGRSDEILLHEFIHMHESNFSGYQDARDKSLKFDGADFLTVNGTNIYSSLLKRGLRKDHTDFSTLPARYNPTEHLVIFRENYDAAHKNNSELIRLFKQQPAVWNPFKQFLPNNYLDSCFIEILPERKWKWMYDFNSDKTARWTDPNNVAQFGSGRWSEVNGKIIIHWTGGSWDNFPRIDFPGKHVSGRNKSAGQEYDSDVWKKPAQPRPG